MSQQFTKSQRPKKQVDAQLQQLKVPPHSIEAEQALIGGLLLDNKAWDKIADKIKIEDFYRADHRLIFQAICNLSQRNIPFDILTVADALKNINELENSGGEVYLFELAKNIPTSANIIAYADIVRERALLRELISVSNEIATNALQTQGRSPNEILDEAERKIFKIAEHQTRGSGPINISGLLASAVDRIDMLYHSNSAMTGIPTSFHDLDELTSGLQKGDLIIVAGRPSMGKTAFAMNMAEHAAIETKKPVLVFSMEMPGDSLAMRMLSSLGRVDQHKVRTGKLAKEDWPRITSAVSMLSEAPMFIDDTPALSPSELRARARRLMREHKTLGLIVIDYLQLMQVPGNRENRAMEISEISRSLKALAKELGVPILALSQLNRSLESRNDRRPVMSDLRESGAIEQDADLIMFIYRDEVYNENSPQKGTAEIIIAKHRNGPIGKITLTFLGQYTRFENFAQQAYTDSVF